LKQYALRYLDEARNGEGVNGVKFNLRQIGYQLQQIYAKKWLYAALRESKGQIKKYTELKNYIYVLDDEERRKLEIVKENGEPNDFMIDTWIMDIAWLDHRIRWSINDKYLTKPIGLGGDDGSLRYNVMCHVCGTIVIERHDDDDCLRPFVCPKCWAKEIEENHGEYWWDFVVAEDIEYDRMIKFIDYCIDFDKKYHFAIKIFRREVYPYRIWLWLKRLAWRIAYAFERKKKC
jgi:hypothetical protein